MLAPRLASRWVRRSATDRRACRSETLLRVHRAQRVRAANHPDAPGRAALAFERHRDSRFRGWIEVRQLLAGCDVPDRDERLRRLGYLQIRRTAVVEIREISRIVDMLRRRYLYRVSRLFRDYAKIPIREDLG